MGQKSTWSADSNYTAVSKAPEMKALGKDKADKRIGKQPGDFTTGVQ